MLPFSLAFVANPANPDCTTTPADRKAVSPLKYHREKSTKLLNQFLTDLFNNDQEALKRIFKEVNAELLTVGYLLRWDHEKALTHSQNIHPPIESESLKLLKNTAYAPLARYFFICRPDNNLLDDPSARSQILKILNEAEKTGADPDRIALIRERCPPLELHPSIIFHQEKSLALLDSLLWAILNRQIGLIYNIYETNQNELHTAAYLLASNAFNAGECAKRSNPPICTDHLNHLKDTAYVPIVQYFELVQQELNKNPGNRELFLTTLTMPQKRENFRSILLLAETCGANPEYVFMCGYILSHL